MLKLHGCTNVQREHRTCCRSKSHPLFILFRKELHTEKITSNAYNNNNQEDLLCASSVISDSLQPYGLQPARLLYPLDSPCKNIGVGCHLILQGIFPAPGIKPVSPAPAGRFFTSEAIWEWLLAQFKYKQNFKKVFNHGQIFGCIELGFYK